MTRDATLLLPASEVPMDVTVQFEYPTLTGAAAGTLLGSVDHVSGQLDLVPGQRPALHLRLPASSAPRTLHLVAPAEFSLPAPDVRRRSIRLLAVTLEPVPSA
jgi:hypothetical protein